jgi:hypothetical protein
MSKDAGWDYEMSHQRLVSARPEVVWQALSELRLADMPVARTLLWLRRLPGRLTGRQYPDAGLPLIDGLRRAGVSSLLAYDKPKLVEIGRISRFWQLAPTNAKRAADRAEFVDFAEPGYAKAVVSIGLTPNGSGTLVVTTTRVRTTDEQARRRFARYWRVVRLGSAATRRALLSAVDRRARRLAAPS